MAQSVKELKARAEKSELSAESTTNETCGNCRYFSEMKEEIGYCSHQEVDMVVGAPWWCQYWEKAG